MEDTNKNGAARQDGREAPAEVPYSEIFRQLGRKMGRALRAPFGKGAAAEPAGTPAPGEYEELTTEDAAIQLLQKLPNKLTERRDARNQNARLAAAQQCLAALDAVLAASAAAGETVGVLFSPHPATDQLNDGYAGRINDVDALLAQRGLRVYIYDAETPLEAGALFACRPAADVFYVKYDRENLAHLEAVAALANRGSYLYMHSVLRVCAPLLEKIALPGILDVHGAVPEEAIMTGDMAGFFRESAHEEYAMGHFTRFVFMSEAQRAQLAEKYHTGPLAGPFLPPFGAHSLPAQDPAGDDRLSRTGAPVVIYTGGIQKWQMADVMLDAMKRRPGPAYRIFTQSEKGFRACCDALGLSGVDIRYVPQAQIPAEYRAAHYGFVLREDTTVNHVATPTKLTEYCAFGIVPILNTPHIGDFVAMGMQYVPLEAFLADGLPDAETRDAMAKNNRAVAEKLAEKYREGRAEILKWIDLVGRGQ